MLDDAKVEWACCRGDLIGFGLAETGGEGFVIRRLIRGKPVVVGLERGGSWSVGNGEVSIAVKGLPSTSVGDAVPPGRCCARRLARTMASDPVRDAVEEFETRRPGGMARYEWPEEGLEEDSACWK